MERAGPVDKVAACFQVEGVVSASRPIGDGLIHRSYQVTTDSEEGQSKYVLQQINTRVFQRPDVLMRNVECVLAQLKRTSECSGDQHRLELVPVADSHESWLSHSSGAWRMYRHIESARTLSRVKTALEAEQIGAAFGRFLLEIEQLSESELDDALPGYRDTEKYYDELQQAAAGNLMGRRTDALDLVNGFSKRSDLAHHFADQVRSGRLRTRPVHGDTKFNNVLFDALRQRALCVIDLDTVMFGPIAKDFGDCYRSILLEAADGQVCADSELRMFRSMTRGFAGKLRSVLAPDEVQSLVDGVRTMLFENGIRFLADYLRGDTYFHTSYPAQNLDRASRHLETLAWVESQAQRMTTIVRTAWQAAPPSRQ